MDSEKKQKLLTTNEAAQYLGVSRSSLANWIRQGLVTGGVTPGGHYRFTTEVLDDFARKRGLKVAASDKQTEDSPNPKILIIDDDEAFHELVTEALDVFSGFELKSAYDGMQGAMQIGAWKPDLVILDVRMPNMDGKELLKLIRQNPETAGLKVIIASAHLSDSLKQEFEELFPDIILEKPVHLVKLVASIQNLVDLKLA